MNTKSHWGKVFFLVEGGEATLADPASTNWDGRESVMVFAWNEEDALRLARLYDEEKIDYDNVIDPRGNGTAVAAICDKNER